MQDLLNEVLRGVKAIIIIGVEPLLHKVQRMSSGLQDNELGAWSRPSDDEKSYDFQERIVQYPQSYQKDPQQVCQLFGLDSSQS